MNRSTPLPASIKTGPVTPHSGNIPDSLDYRELPSSAGFSALFLDYLTDFEEVGHFFPANFREDQSYASLFESVRSRRFERGALVSILQRQNRQFGNRTAAEDNITLLRKDTTYAVVTGQQVGLFGGPLFTVYKTITCLRTCAGLKSRFPEFDFVPVFWLESEDHDFHEVSSVTVLDRSGLPVRVEYLPETRAQMKNTGPVGELTLTSGINEVFRSLEESLLATEFTGEILSSLRACYREGTSLLDAFVGWISFLFEGTGLVFLNPSDPELKQHLAPLFEQEIAEYPATSQLVVRRSAELEERYHAQVKPKSVNLFLLHRGGRYLIEPRETDFSLKGTRQYFSQEEMSALLRSHPERFSPNVVLRPVAQDFILPTVAYIGGPSEIAYQAQLSGVYQHFGVVQPVIVPRASATFIEDRVDRIASKYQIPAVHLFEDREKVTERILGQIAGVNIDSLFQTAQKTTESMIAELSFGLTEIDPTMKGPLEGSKGKIEGALAGLKEKSLAAQKRKNETAVRQIERALHTVMPGGNLQERELTIVYYLNKYGPDMVRWLSAELRTDIYRHQLLTL